MAHGARRRAIHGPAAMDDTTSVTAMGTKSTAAWKAEALPTTCR